VAPVTRIGAADPLIETLLGCSRRHRRLLDSLTIATGLRFVKPNRLFRPGIRCAKALFLRRQRKGDSDAICAWLSGPSYAGGFCQLERDLFLVFELLSRHKS
jgi:hypothetical protein